MTITILSIAYWLGFAAVGWCICWLMLRSDHSLTTYFFIGNHSALALWLISQLLILQSVTDKQLWMSYTVGNLGVSFTGTFWLLFVLNYVDRKTPKNFVNILMSFSLIFYVIILTNPYHHLYYKNFEIGSIVYGPAFFIGQAYIYSAFLTGIYMVIRCCFMLKQRPKSQGILILLATCIPLTINLISISGLIKTKIAVTPLTFALSGILILLATYRYDFLNVNGVAFEDAFNSIAEGVVIFNRRGRVTYISSAARKLLGANENTLLSDILSMTGDDPDEPAEITIDGVTASLRHYRCLDSKGVTVAHIIIATDITHYYELLDRTAQLAAAERSLALEHERNRIAQEVHDTAGHTLTMITSLARLSQAAAEKVSGEGLNDLKEYLKETESISRSGVTQLRCSINNLRDDSFLKSVTGAVKMICDSVRDMETELCIQGSEDGRFNFCIREIYDSTRELITNCMRYSSADRIDIILRFGETALEMFYFDNGKGCLNIKEGNGLRGIRERTEKLGGSVTFSSGGDEGFRATIKLPIKKEENK